MTDECHEEEIAAVVARQISLETGLVFDAERRDAEGFSGWALTYHAQIDSGYAFDVVLAVGFRSVEVTVRPTQYSGRLVRSFASALAANPNEWREQLGRVRAEGAAVTIYVDGEVLIAPDTLPDAEFRQFEIECVVRTDGRGEAARRAAAVAGARAAVSLTLTGLELQASDAVEDLNEGAVVRVEVNKYERNPVARLQCIAHYGASCWACDLSFGDTYGELGAGYIHVHHRVLVSSYEGESYVVDPIRDLVPLCPNCHMMIHRRRPPLDPAELREILGRPMKDPLPTPSTVSS